MPAAPEDTAAGRRPYHHGDLAAEAASAAMALVREGGEASVSLRKVAEAAGVSHRAVYNHYDGRDALLRTVVVQGYAALAQALSGTKDRRAFAEAYLRFALAEPHLYDLTMSRAEEQWADPSLRAAALSVIAAARAATGEADSAIKRLWMVLHGGLSLHRSGGLQPRNDEDLVAFMLEMAEG